MSHKLINHSPDLKRLCDEEYGLEINGAHLLLHEVPYVNGNREIKFGTLVSTLTLSAPEKTAKPDTHVIHFIGELPCNFDGTPIQGLLLGSGNQILDPTHGITVNHSFSNKPANGFNDYYEKFTSYVRIITSQAQAIDDKVTARTGRVIVSTHPDYPFKYVDTNSSRAEIVAISHKLEGHKIAIVGLGGTGSYVLDFVAKTPVREIHLFDGDGFSVHNAFRAPGAASVGQLDAHPKKVKHLHDVYSNMHRFIIPHEFCVNVSNLEVLAGMSFVFLCIDDGAAKMPIIEMLVGAGIPFCDVGIGVQSLDNALTGSVRVTTCTATKHDHIKDRITYLAAGEDDYAQNIQIAELNALNAIQAVIKWKKLVGFYHDLENEHHAVYEINTNKIITDDAGS
jgi:hypothetical protein